MKKENLDWKMFLAHKGILKIKVNLRINLILLDIEVILNLLVFILVLKDIHLMLAM